MPTAVIRATLGLAVALLAACSSPAATPSAATPPGAVAGAATGAGSTASSGAPQAVLVHGLDSLHFDPSTVTVHAGQPVQLTFVNSGEALHDWSIVDGPAHPVKIVAAGGQTATATFTIDRPGTINFTCSQPGHAAAGMHGTLVAQ